MFRLYQRINTSVYYILCQNGTFCQNLVVDAVGGFTIGRLAGAVIQRPAPTPEGRGRHLQQTGASSGGLGPGHHRSAQLLDQVLSTP